MNSNVTSFPVWAALCLLSIPGISSLANAADWPTYLQSYDRAGKTRRTTETASDPGLGARLERCAATGLVSGGRTDRGRERYL